MKGDSMNQYKRIFSTNTMKVVCAGILMVGLQPSVSLAAPSVNGVSGTISLGSSATISGSGFGSHPLAVESLQANIEAGTTGQKLNKTGWIQDWGWANPLYATDSAHSGSKSLKCSLTGGTQYNCAFAYDMPNVGPGQTMYATWWVKYNGDTGGQWKMFRASEQQTIVDANQTVAMFNWLNSASQLAPIGQTYLWPEGSTYPAGDNKWYRVELIFKASSANASDGVLTVNRYTDTGTLTGQTFSGVKTHEASNDSWSYAIFQNYVGNGINSATIWLDDLYVQHNTQARVELCSGSTWSNRGKCEIQVPSSWGSSSVSATLNTGSFASGSSAYLYVVDSSGAANSSGYAVKIGNSTSSSTPTPTPVTVPAPKLNVIKVQ
jgi:hypothetical protein